MDQRGADTLHKDGDSRVCPATSRGSLCESPKTDGLRRDARCGWRMIPCHLLTVPSSRRLVVRGVELRMRTSLGRSGAVTLPLDTIRADLATRNRIQSILYPLQCEMAIVGDPSLLDTLPWGARYDAEQDSNGGAVTPTQASSSSAVSNHHTHQSRS
jgi:hypothetical protein